MILEEVERHGQKWRIVAAALPGRSDDSVRNRWKRLVKDKPRVAGAAAGVAVSTAGEPADGGDPSAESARGTKQAGKSKAKVTDRLAWSREEDDLIVRSVQEFGLKWGKIQTLLPAPTAGGVPRSAHAIRNRFHRLQVLQAELRAR